jgi:hypothetical protein
MILVGAAQRWYLQDLLSRREREFSLQMRQKAREEAQSHSSSDEQNSNSKEEREPLEASVDKSEEKKGLEEVTIVSNVSNTTTSGASPNVSNSKTNKVKMRRTSNSSSNNSSESDSFSSPNTDKKYQRMLSNQLEEFLSATIEAEYKYPYFDPCPFQVIDKTPLSSLHFMFNMLGITHAFVTSNGRLVGVVTKKTMMKKCWEYLYKNKNYEL